MRASRQAAAAALLVGAALGLALLLVAPIDSIRDVPWGVAGAAIGRWVAGLLLVGGIAAALLRATGAFRDGEGGA